MGQKVHPTGFRVGILYDWQSRYFSEGDYKGKLHEDFAIRKMVKLAFHHAGVSKVEIERAGERAVVTIHTARPGIVIGRKGASIEELREAITKTTGRPDIVLKIEEVKRPDLDAQLLAENVSNQLLRRISFRRAMKRAVQNSMKAGALGVKIQCKGRLGGAEMSRTEWYREGRVPLHTLRADISYGFTEAKTKYGMIGVKAWIFRGEKFEREAVVPSSAKG